MSQVALTTVAQLIVSPPLTYYHPNIKVHCSDLGQPEFRKKGAFNMYAPGVVWVVYPSLVFGYYEQQDKLTVEVKRFN